MTPSSIQVSNTCRSRYVNCAINSVSRIMSGCAFPARVLRMRPLPLGHELGQRLVGAFRRNDVNVDQVIAASARLTARHALATQPQLGALPGAPGHLDVDGPVHGLDAHAGPIERL